MNDDESATERLRLQIELSKAGNRISGLKGAINRIHKLAVKKWSDGNDDGWLRVMQIAENATRVEQGQA